MCPRLRIAMQFQSIAFTTEDRVDAATTHLMIRKSAFATRRLAQTDPLASEMPAASHRHSRYILFSDSKSNLRSRLIKETANGLTSPYAQAGFRENRSFTW